MHPVRRFCHDKRRSAPRMRRRVPSRCVRNRIPYRVILPAVGIFLDGVWLHQGKGEVQTQKTGDGVYHFPCSCVVDDVLGGHGGKGSVEGVGHGTVVPRKHVGNLYVQLDSLQEGGILGKGDGHRIVDARLHRHCAPFRHICHNSLMDAEGFTKAAGRYGEEDGQDKGKCTGSFHLNLKWLAGGFWDPDSCRSSGSQSAGAGRWRLRYCQPCR